MSLSPHSLAGRCPARPCSLLLPSVLAVGCLTAFLPMITVAADPGPVAIGPYDAAVAYPAGSLAIGPDGNTYRASKEVKGFDPTQAKADAWQLAHVSREVILDVPGRFRTIAEAMAFLAGCRIAETAKAVVLVAPGKLEHDAPLVLNHAEGARIVIRGAGDKPEECVLLFEDDDADDQDGLVVNDGHAMTLDNLTIESATRQRKGIGLLIDSRATVTLSSCRFNDFTCVLGGNSHLSATKCEFQMNRPGDGVHIRNNSEALLVDCVLIAKPGNAGVGCHAFNGGVLQCSGTRVIGWSEAFKAHNGSCMHIERCTARGGVYGASAFFSSSLTIADSTFEKNSEFGIGAIFATVSIDGCNLDDNQIGVAVVGNGYAQFVGGATTISDGRVGVRVLGGGRADLSVTAPKFGKIQTDLEALGRPCDLSVEEAFMK